MGLLPKDEKFFDLFCDHSKLICRASDLLYKGLGAGYNEMCRTSPEIKEIEKRGDEIVHDIFRRLEATFLTPIDPEDIQALATALDNVLDHIEDVTFRIVAYRLNPIPEAAVRLAEIVKRSCEAVSAAVQALQKKQSLAEHSIEVNRLENEADTLERMLMADLFRTELDPITLIKQKEVYEILEQTTDRCEDVADVLQGVAVKNS
jgi:predicted phosphate transport protein (TIGR00153 family)